MNIIFDFDGTICDSFETTLGIANDYLARFGKKQVDPKRFKEEGIEEIIKDYKLNKFQILLYVLKGRRELAKHITRLHTFAGLTKVIRKLSETNTLGIVSSNSRKNIHTFLKKEGIDRYFKFIESSPTIFEKSKKIELVIKRYKFEKNQTIYVGDEIRDIDAAKKTGIKCVTVTWGFANKNLLKRFHPDFLIDSPRELLSMEKQLLP